MRWVSCTLSLVIASGSDKAQITFVTPGVPKLYAFHTHTHMLPRSQLFLVTRIFVKFIKKSLLTLDVIFGTSISCFLFFPLQILSTRFVSSFVLDARDSTKAGTVLALRK